MVGPDVIDRVKENGIELAIYINDTDVVARSIDENAEAPDCQTMERQLMLNTRASELQSATHQTIPITYYLSLT